MKILMIASSGILCAGLLSMPLMAGDTHKHEEHKHEGHEHEGHKHDEHKHDEHKHDEHKHDEHKHEMEHHGAHEHGSAKLMLAMTENGFEAMLDTPAANVFGFEHAPNTDEQRQRVKTAADVLVKADTWLIANNDAKCVLKDNKIESALLATQDHDDHDHAEHKHDDHDHAEHKHDDHDDHKKETHSDVEASWTFVCDNPAKIKKIDITLFSAFPKGFEHLKVEWLTQTGASSHMLEKDGAITLN